MIAIRPENPLIVQSDRTLLLEVAHPAFEQVRDQLAPFAELVKSPEHTHTLRGNLPERVPGSSISCSRF